MIFFEAVNAENYSWKRNARSSRFASETDLSVRSDRTFTPIAVVEGLTGGKAAGKDRLGNRLRHAENYADAIIPNNFVRGFARELL